MHLIVGLGNIGEKYQYTRHNVGFMVIDKMTKNLTTSNINNSNFQSTLLKSGYNLFSKPTTFMNNSGLAVHAIKEYYKIDLENIIAANENEIKRLNEKIEELEKKISQQQDNRRYSKLPITQNLDGFEIKACVWN